MPFSFNPRSFGRYNAQPTSSRSGSSQGGLAPPYNGPAVQGFQPNGFPQAPSVTRSEIRRETQPRHAMAILSSLSLFGVLIFLIMVEIGNTHNKPGLRDMYFLKLDFANIQPISNSTPGLGYGIAESFGFYDFYQIGLWNYCEGWNSTGITQCTQPNGNYWFNPVAIFADQINKNANASVTMPPDLTSSLDEIKVCSHVMFGMFLTGACLSFLLIPAAFFSVKSKWISLGLAITTFFNMLLVLASTIIATAIFVIIRNIFRDYEEIVNIVPKLGNTMFAMMWIAAIFSILAFLSQVFLSCFFVSERGVRLGKKDSTESFW